MEVGPTTGAVRISEWATWVQEGVVTSGSYDGESVEELGTSTYVASWSTEYQAPQPTA